MSDQCNLPCGLKCRGEEKTPHSFLAEKGEYNEIYAVKCGACGYEHDVDRQLWLNAQVVDWVRPRKAYLTKFPYFEPHTGELVHSKEHREEVLRAHGFHAAPHGINERYNDEATESLASRRREAEKRKRDRQEYLRARGIRR